MSDVAIDEAIEHTGAQEQRRPLLRDCHVNGAGIGGTGVRAC